MKTIASILPIAAAVVSLAGCNEADTVRQTKTVGWLFDHRDELAVRDERRPEIKDRRDGHKRL